MSYKYYGRLAGKTPDARSEAAPANATTIFDPASPATKFLSYGEGGTSLAWNRALTALSGNTDHIMSVFDAPAPRVDVLAYRRADGAKFHGYNALQLVAAGATEIDLGGDTGPVQWVYVGLHQSKLGEYIQLVRSLSGPDYPDASVGHWVKPTDIEENDTVGASYFPAAPNYVGSPDQAVPDYIPGAVRARPTLAPYSSAVLPVTVSAWDKDGVYFTSYEADEIYVRPGVLVEVANADIEADNGLFRVAAVVYNEKVQGAKLLLTRAYQEIVVEDGTNFAVGEKITWRSPTTATSGPDQLHTIASNSEDRENSAHVVYKVLTNDDPLLLQKMRLYVASFAGGEDFKYSDGVAYRSNITDAGYRGYVQHNQIGLVDKESGANQHWSLPVDTLVYEVGGTSSAVTDCMGQGAPVNLTGRSTTGVFYVVSPPGWLLNPMLQFDANHIIGGNYNVHCYTLSTIKERLLSSGSSAVQGTLEDPSVGHGLTRGRLEALTTFQKFSKVGYQLLSISTDDLNTPYGPTKRILGEDLWTVYVERTAGAGTIAAEFGINADADWVHPNGETTYSEVVQSGEDPGDATKGWVTLRKVSRYNWTDFAVSFNDDPIITGSIRTLAGTAWTVDSITYAPKLQGFGVTYYPTIGLNAAYHCQFLSDAGVRGKSGFGNRIDLAAGKPLALRLADAATQTAVAVYSAPWRDTALIEHKLHDGTAKAAISVDGTNYAMSFDDANTGTAIPLSDAGNTTLPLGYTSILGALNDPKVLSGVYGYGGFSTASLGIPAVTYSGAGGDVIDVAAATYLYKGDLLDVAAAPAVATLAVGQWTYLKIDLSTTTYSVVTYADPGAVPPNNIDWENENVLYLRKIITDAGPGITIESDILLTPPLTRTDRKTDIFVGSIAASTYADDAAHFLTVSEAFAAIDVWVNETPFNTIAGYRVRVVGPVTEVPTDLPLVVPVDGMIIEGVPLTPSAEDHVGIAWSGDEYLFDVTGRTNVVFRDLYLAYNDGVAASLGTPDRYAFGGANTTGIQIERVRIRAIQPTRLHGYVSLTSGTNKEMCIRDCDWTGASDFGVLALDVDGDFLMDSCRLVRGGVNQTAAGGDGGINITGLAAPTVEGLVRISGCTLVDFPNLGIFVDSAPEVTIADNRIHGVEPDGTGVTSESISVGSDCLRAVVKGNFIVGGGELVLTGNDAYGIHVSCPNALVEGNHIDLVDHLNPATSAIFGIHLEATATFATVRGNLLGGSHLYCLGQHSTVADNNMGKPDGASKGAADNDNASPTVITTAAHGLTVGWEYYVWIAGTDPVQVNGVWPATIIDATTFSIPLDMTILGGNITPGTWGLVYRGDLFVNAGYCTVSGNNTNGGEISIYGHTACSNNVTRGGDLLLNFLGGDLEGQCAIQGNNLLVHALPQIGTEGTSNGSIDLDSSKNNVVVANHCSTIVGFDAPTDLLYTASYNIIID